MSGAALVSVAIPAAAVSTAYFLIFEGLRGSFTQFFAPRFPGSKEGKYPYPSLFGWVRGILQVPEQEIVDRSGMDAAVYLRFLWLGTVVMAILTVLGMLLLMPVYATGENDMSDLPRLGLSNVEQESSRLWAPAIMIWVFSGIILYVIKKNYTELLAMRKETMKKGEPNHYTVLITKIPEEFDSEEKVREFMEPMYSEQIAHVKLVRNLKERERKTTELVKQKLKLVVAMKKAEDAKEKGEDPPMVKTGCCGLCGESVEAVPHYTQKVKEIREEIETKLRVEDAEYCKAAFVTFKTVSSAIRAATRPTDITWPNLCSVKMKAVEDTAVMTSNAAKWGLIVFWAIPIAAGGALSNLEQLGQDYSFLEGVTSLPPALIAIIEGFGPTIWRVVLMILLQPIIYALINMTGVIEISAKENKFMSTYYFFLLTNIYFVTLLASSIFSTINDIVNDPVSIFELLGESIPAVAIEMIQYMLLQGLGLGVEPIVRLVPLILNILFNKLAVVDYQREQLNKPPPFLYGAGLSMACLIWTISLAYMTIAPLILPFATLYFFINYLVQKYQLTWVHCPDFETYGTFWPQLMSIAMGGLLLSQVATMAIIGLKFGSFQQILIFPVIFITAMCMYQMQSTMGEEMSDSSLPLLNATHLDKERNLASVGKFLDVCHARPMWAQPCVLVRMDDPLREPPAPPILLHGKGDDMKDDPAIAEVKDEGVKQDELGNDKQPGRLSSAPETGSIEIKDVKVDIDEY